jgi:hypothetical protein
MRFEGHISTAHRCKECGAAGFNERQFRDHLESSECGAESSFEDSFPSYYVCGEGVNADNYTPVYLRIDSETGPMYMTKTSWEYVERTTEHELIQHDWESVVRENTPFPRFE